MAGRPLRAKKVGSLLTMLGVIVGDGSVIAGASITTGATKQVEAKVASLGQNVLTVYSGSSTGSGSRGGGAGARSICVGRRSPGPTRARTGCSLRSPSSKRFSIVGRARAAGFRS